MATARVAVVGAGIAGLSAAHALHSADSNLEILVLEASPRIGGKLLVGSVAGVAADVGAEALLNRRPEAVALARTVGLADDLCHPATSSAAIWTGGAIRPMPPTVMGIPTRLAALRRSGIVSASAIARASLEPLLPRRSLHGDVSVADYVAGRLGRQIVDRLVEPLLGGVYAGHAVRLSLRAAAPQIAALAEGTGSLTTAARATKRDAGPELPVFAGIRGGVGRLPERVAATSGATVRTSSTVRELVRRDCWHLLVGSTRHPEVVAADAVVLATPAPATARLLSSLSISAADELRGIEYASTAVVTMAMPVSSLSEPLTGSGFLAPPVDGRTVKAATYSSLKWGWLGKALGEGVVVVRASIGRHGEEQLLQRDDADLVAVATADLSDAVGLRGPVLDAVVTRWGGGLPQYVVGHLDRVSRIRDAVASLPSIEVCGAAYDGIGVAACVADGQKAADRLLASLRARGTLET